MAEAEAGLSGHTVRGLVEGQADAAIQAPALVAPGQPEAGASGHELAETIRQAGDFALRSLDLAGQAIGKAVDVASDKAFQGAANVGADIAHPGPPDFSWTGYLQALGIMCLLLGALWFAVYAIRRWGKFNFLPRPGALPRDCLVMEAQMPLGPRKGLMVVRFMNKRLLLGVTDQNISLITEAQCEDKRSPSKFDGFLDDARDHDSAAGAPSA